jgi:hypothetical protein
MLIVFGADEVIPHDEIVNTGYCCEKKENDKHQKKKRKPYN